MNPATGGIPAPLMAATPTSERDHHQTPYAADQDHRSVRGVGRLQSQKHLSAISAVIPRSVDNQAHAISPK